MNLRDIEYLIAVAENRHFGRAAERCHVSQPTLSGQIKKLEETLGVSLFERSNRSVQITPIGATILAHARQMLEQAEIIEALARAQQDPLAGPLRLGIIPTLSPYLMPLILAPLRQQHEQMRLVLAEELTDTLLQRLLAHEIDAALLATEVTETGLEQLPLFRESFWLACPAGHTLAQQEEIKRDDLDRADLLLLAEGHCLARQALEVCHLKQRSGAGAMADLRAASLETLLQLVAAGYGATLVPALAAAAVKARYGDIVLRPLPFPDAWRQVSLVFRSTFPRRAALTALTQIIERQLVS